MSFPLVGSATAFRTQKSLSFDLDDMVKKAKTYTESNFENADDLFEYIQNILHDSRFQKDPKGFLAELRKKRGITEQRKWPADFALQFLDNNFRF